MTPPLVLDLADLFAEDSWSDLTPVVSIDADTGEFSEQELERLLSLCRELGTL